MSSNLSVDVVLDCAADYLERYGWCQNQFTSDANSYTAPVCVLGAIGLVTTGDPVWEDANPPMPVLEPLEALCDWLVSEGVVPDHLNAHLWIEDVYDWNDDPRRTADQVIGGLRAAAERVRHG